MIYISIVIALLSAALFFYHEISIKRMKVEVKKYKFYKLRDEIIWEIVNTKKSKELEEVYAITNFVIANLDKVVKDFDFTFFSGLVSGFIRENIERLTSSDPNCKKIECKILKEKEIKLAKLILREAKYNSIPLRFFMSKIGYFILVKFSIYKEILRIMPSLIAERQRQKCQTIVDSAKYYKHLQLAKA